MVYSNNKKNKMVFFNTTLQLKKLVLLAFTVLLVCASAFLLNQKRHWHKKSNKAASERAVVELVKQRLEKVFKDGTSSTATFFANNLEGASPEIIVSAILEQTRQFLRTTSDPTDSGCFDTLEITEGIVVKTIAILDQPVPPELHSSIAQLTEIKRKVENDAADGGVPPFPPTASFLPRNSELLFFS